MLFLIRGEERETVAHIKMNTVYLCLGITGVWNGVCERCREEWILSRPLMDGLFIHSKKHWVFWVLPCLWQALSLWFGLTLAARALPARHPGPSATGRTTAVWATDEREASLRLSSHFWKKCVQRTDEEAVRATQTFDAAIKNSTKDIIRALQEAKQEDSSSSSFQIPSRIMWWKKKWT